ncbi:Lysine methyltransferase, partial [Dillenia turbinata]
SSQAGEEESMELEREEDEIVCLDETFFINDDYKLTKFSFGSHVLELFCLQSACTDFDLTGQLVWPGATLLTDFLSKNEDMLKGCSVIELGSGVGVTGILCSKFCHQVVLTDHNEEILKRNIELHGSSNSATSCEVVAEKLEWGNALQISKILQRYSGGFDLVLGADIYILTIYSSLFLIFKQALLCMHACVYKLNYLKEITVEAKFGTTCISFQQSSIPLLFDTVGQLLSAKREKCKFLLAYVSRAKIMDTMVLKEAVMHGLQVREVVGTRSTVGNLEGVIFEMTLE